MNRSIFRIVCVAFLAMTALTASVAKAQTPTWFPRSASYENISVDSQGRVNVVGLQVWWLEGPSSTFYDIYIDYYVSVDNTLLGGNQLFEDTSGSPTISRDPMNPDSAQINLQSAALSPGWHTVTITEFAYVLDPWDNYSSGDAYFDESELRSFQVPVYVP